MPNILTIYKKSNCFEKILLINFLILIIRLITPRIAFIDNIGNINTNFLLVTIFMNIFLINIIYRTLKKENIKISKKESIFITIISLIIIGLSTYVILNRHMLYYQDNAVYYSKQLALRGEFNTRSLFGTFRVIVGDIWYSDYGCFLNLFLELTNAFTNYGTDAYVIATIILIVPYVIFAIYSFLKYVFKNTTNKYLYLLLSVFVLMPLLHVNLLEGMPDVFGLVFIFLIIILTINYDFKKIDIERLILLGIVTFFLIITRRWYLYFIVSYYIIYILSLIIPLIIKRDYKNLKIVILNGLKFALIYGLILAISLYPMIHKIIKANYTESYVAYKEGNLLFEFGTELKRYGLASVILSLIGYLLLLKKENKPFIKYLILFPTFFLTIILFNTVQNFGVHHLLMLIPSLLFGITFIIYYLIKYKSYLLVTIIMLILSINFVYSINNKLKDNLVFTNISLISERRTDISEVKTISRWILDNTQNGEVAYMIPHGHIYNPDIFKFALAPTIISYDSLPYGSAMLGSQAFPVELFDANYVLTSTPFTGYSISYKYDEAFMNSPFFNTCFKLIKEFDMHNGYIFKIYERISPITLEEINYYLEYFQEENSKYYQMYGQVINDYINNKYRKVNYEE